MNNETMVLVDELVDKLKGIIPEWRARETGNNVMQVILNELGSPETSTYYHAFISALALALSLHKCKSHDCGCPDCPNSFYNYDAVVQQGFDVNREVKVEVKVEVPTTTTWSGAYVPSSSEIAWRKAAIEVFKANDKYGAMSLPTLTSMVLTNRGAQPSNYSKMEAAFKNYLHTPDGESWFVITRGRNGGVRVRHSYRDETWQ
jgi:hypothetical protein